MIDKAIRDMESKGIYQWDSVYPAREDFEKDIVQNNLYDCRRKK